MSKYLITPSLTSLNQTKMSHRHYLDVRLAELKKSRLKEISLFVTTADKNEREYIRRRLLETMVESIPHVHLRNDTSEAEAMYYYQKYNTRAFTIHHKFRKNFIKWSQELRQCIGMENNEDMQALDDLEKFGGLVIDLSHYIMHQAHQPAMAVFFEKAISQFPILVNHASGIFYKTKKDTHWIFNQTNYDYLADVPKKCFANIISLEVGNSFATQRRHIGYINKILKNV